MLPQPYARTTIAVAGVNNLDRRGATGQALAHSVGSEFFRQDQLRFGPDQTVTQSGQFEEH